MTRARRAGQLIHFPTLHTERTSAMNLPREIRTQRLLLRRWCPADREPFAAMNADLAVMEFFPAPLTREESDSLVDRNDDHFQRHGYGRWAVEAPGVAPFLGFIGLAIPGYETPFTPCVEVGWRLARPFWGRGYATEGARAALGFGFQLVGLPEIVSFTAALNVRSWRVMERLGMTTDPAEDFSHPLVPKGHPLERHVLYRLGRADHLPASSS